MTAVADEMDQLRIAIGEVDVLAALTAAAYDAADWCESDPDVVEAIATLLGLISKSAAAAKAAFLRVQSTVADAQPMPAGVEWDYSEGTAQGPTALQMFNLKSLNENGREPTFEEKRRWDEDVEHRIGAYLREHPEKANALDVSTFKFVRQAAVGQDKEQVLILLGPPLAVSYDQGHMQQLARSYWPLIEGNATEVWIYPVGWSLFFSGQRLVDMTQYVAPPK